MFVLLVVVLWIGFACIPASIASSKGRTFFGYWLFGLFFFLPALVVVLLQPPLVSSNAPGMRSCPLCLSAIPARATVCSHCRRDVPPISVVARSAAET